MVTHVLLVVVAVVFAAGVVAAWRRWILVTAGSAAAVFACRLVLVGWGYVYDAGTVHALDVLVAGGVLLVAASARDRLGSAGATGEQRIALVGAVVALPVAAVALAQLFGPAAPPQNGAAACHGAAVAGSRMQARTGQFGLNARSGPGTTYEPEGRFDAECTVGVDGYCVGEPVQDIVVPLPDARWLRLRHSDRYVAAGTIFALGPESVLGSSPESSCPEHQADPELTAAPQVSTAGNGMLLVSARPARTKLVGFGLFYQGSSPQRVEQLGVTPKLVNDETGQVFVRFSIPGTRALGPGTDTVVIAAVPCLAPVVPSHTGDRFIRVNLRTGKSSALDPATASVPVGRLRQAACRIDPSASDQDIKAGAASQPPNPARKHH